MAGKAGKPEDELQTVSITDRKVIGAAIIEGLISPSALAFERLATEGGDYNQGDGGYTQSGGGNHNQGGGDYNQSSMVGRDYLEVVNLAQILRGAAKLRG